MRNPRVLLGSLTAAVALVVITSVAAYAANGPYLVKAGTRTTGTTTYTAATVPGADPSAPQIQFSVTHADGSAGPELGCNSGTANGVIRLGNNATGVYVGSITSSTWNGCTGPLGLPLTVSQSSNWRLDGLGQVNANKVLAGKIVAIKAFVSAANPTQCSFNVSGFVRGKLIQTPTTNQRLSVGGTPALSNLTISDVQGCFSQVRNGDKATFAATYKLNVAAGALDITNAP